ncbi:MAG: hypothetical protein ABSE70_06625 [Candidatus Limnocylindrales bacterium]
MDKFPPFDSLPGAFHVTGWVAEGGRVTLQLDALTTLGVGATETDARLALVAEIRTLIGRWQTEPRFGRSFRWQHRGVVIELLAAFTDTEIDELLEVDMEGHSVPNLDQRYDGYSPRSPRRLRRR